MTRKLNTFKKIPLVSALALMSSAAISADFAREEFVMTGTTIDYVDFNLIDQSVIDIATASAWSDPEILLFSGTSSNLGVLLGRDDDSCLSVDCGLVTGQQFNAVIDDIVLESGDYTVVLGANDVTEDEARNDFNEESSAANSVASDVLLKVGDKNMIIAGTATGTGSLEFIGFTEAIRLGQLSNIDGGLQINPNNINAGMAINRLCATQDNDACGDLKRASNTQQAQALSDITPEEVSVVSSSTVATNNMSVSGVNARLSNLKSGNIGGINILGTNLLGGGAGDGDDLSKGLFDRVGVFVNAQGGFGDKQQTINESGYGFQSGSLTIGADAALTDNFIVGLAFNYTSMQNTFNGNAGKLENNQYNGSIFSSVYMNDFYLDGIFTIGGTDFDSSRNVSYATNNSSFDKVAKGNTGAMQYLVSLDLGYNYQFKGFLITPSVGFNYAKTFVDGYEESGAEIWNIGYQDQEIESALTNLGVSLSHSFSTSFGVLTPQFHMDWMHEFSYHAQAQTVYFVADKGLNNNFVMISDSPDRDYMQVGVNLAAQFKHGLSAFASYDSIAARSNVSNHSFSVGIRWEI